jgi:hypothetical protein
MDWRNIASPFFLFNVRFCIEIFGCVFSNQPQQSGNQSSENPFDACDHVSTP